MKTQHSRRLRALRNNREEKTYSDCRRLLQQLFGWRNRGNPQRKTPHISVKEMHALKRTRHMLRNAVHNLSREHSAVPILVRYRDALAQGDPDKHVRYVSPESVCVSLSRLGACLATIESNTQPPLEEIAEAMRIADVLAHGFASRHGEAD